LAVSSLAEQRLHDSQRKDFAANTRHLFGSHTHRWFYQIQPDFFPISLSMTSICHYEASASTGDITSSCPCLVADLQQECIGFKKLKTTTKKNKNAQHPMSTSLVLIFNAFILPSAMA